MVVKFIYDMLSILNQIENMIYMLIINIITIVSTILLAVVIMYRFKNVYRPIESTVILFLIILGGGIVSTFSGLHIIVVLILLIIIVMIYSFNQQHKYINYNNKIDIKNTSHITVIILLLLQIIIVVKLTQYGPFITPIEDAINYVYYSIKYQRYGETIIEHSSKIFFMALAAYGDPAIIASLLISLHLVIVIAVLVDILRSKIDFVKVTGMYFFPPLIGFKAIWLIQSLQLDFLHMVWSGAGYIIPFYNLSYPFLWETSKIFFLAMFFFGIFIYSNRKYISLFAALLSYVIEPEVLLFFGIIGLVLKLPLLKKLTIVIGSIIYPILYEERVADLVGLFLAIPKEMVVLAIGVIISIGLSINKLAKYLNIGFIYNSSPLINKFLLFIGALVLFVSYILDLNVDKKILFSHFAWLIILISLIRRNTRVLTPLLNGIVILSFISVILFTLELFHFFEFYSRIASSLYTLFLLELLYRTNKSNIIHLPFCNNRFILLLSVICGYLLTFWPWVFINFPGGVVDYSKFLELSNVLNTSVPFIIISDYDPTYTYFSRFYGGDYIFVHWKYNLSHLVPQILMLNLSVSYLPSFNIIVFSNVSEYIVVEVNDIYNLYIDSQMFEISHIVTYEYKCMHSVVNLTILTAGHTRFRIYSYEGGKLVFGKSLLLPCREKIYIIASQQVCRYCGLDSWPRILIFYSKNAMFST